MIDLRQLATEGGMFDEVLEGTFSEPSQSRLGAVSEPPCRRAKLATSKWPRGEAMDEDDD